MFSSNYPTLINLRMRPLLLTFWWSSLRFCLFCEVSYVLLDRIAPETSGSNFDTKRRRHVWLLIKILKEGRGAEWSTIDRTRT